MSSLVNSIPAPSFAKLEEDLDLIYQRIFDPTINGEQKITDIILWLINVARTVSETNRMAPEEVLVSTVLLSEYDGAVINITEIIMFKTFFEKNRETIDDLAASKINTLNESPEMIEKIKRNFSCIISDEIGHLMSFIDQCAEAGDEDAMAYYAAMI